MTSMLKPLTTTVALGLVVVSAAFANVAPASAGDCVKVAGQYFVDGRLQPSCKSSKPYKVVGDKHEANSPECNGKPAGHKFLKMVNNRLARFTCT